MSARFRRGLLAMLTVAAGIVLVPAAGAVTLGPSKAVSSPNAWSVGNALGRTSGYLQAAWASDCPPPSGACATDRGPFVGVFWQRDALSTSAPWSAPRRLSPTKMHAARPALAASGSGVYVAWVTQASYLHYRSSSPREVWVRASRDQGVSWRAPIRLSFAGTRADYPVVAASGDGVWVVWTNAGTGEIRMARSTDAGSHWIRTTIGTTTSGGGSAEGYRGFPAIGASGQNVVALWFATPGGRQVALTSDQGATDWSATSTPSVLVNSSPNGGLRYPAARGADDGQSSRVAVAYTTGSRLEVRVFDGSTLGDAEHADGPWPHAALGRTYGGAYGPSVAPSGTEGVVVAWAACRRVPGLVHPCAPDRSEARIDILERESVDDGATWSSRVAVASASKGSAVNEAPSVLADSVLSRTWFLWLGHTAAWASYRVFGRTG